MSKLVRVIIASALVALGIAIGALISQGTEYNMDRIETDANGTEYAIIEIYNAYTDTIKYAEVKVMR